MEIGGHRGTAGAWVPWGVQDAARLAGHRYPFNYRLNTINRISAGSIREGIDHPFELVSEEFLQRRFSEVKRMENEAIAIVLVVWIDCRVLARLERHFKGQSGADII